DALEPDRPVAHHGIQFGGGGEAAETPDFLVPAAPDDPRAFGIGGGILGDLALGLGERAGFREVDGEQAQPEAHHVCVRVDQAGNDRPATAVLAVVGTRGTFAIADELGDLALVVDQHGLEARDGAGAVYRDAVDVVDQRVGLGGYGEGEEGAKKGNYAETRRRG